jgi:hypothetical protein
MSNEQGPFVTVAMREGGYYSAATTGAKDVIDGAAGLVLDAIGHLPSPISNRAFVISDFGCADGGTSIDLMRAAVDAARSRWPGRPVTVVYTDQPRNDFNSLFRRLHGLTDAPTYLHSDADVFVMASATSFYDQILPAGTLDLGFSATAMHWLSRKPCDLSNHVHPVGASETELAVFAAQGQRDWETILLRRAEELAPGGRMVLVNFCRDEQGRYLGNTGGVNMFDTFNALWQRFVADDQISAAEYLSMTFPQYYKTVGEFAQPLEETGPVQAAGLRMEHIETRVVPCPYATAFRQHRDADRFAREYVPTLRSWTESTFASALSIDRSAEDRSQIIDSFYAEYETLVREAPEGHGMDYVHVYMVLAKTLR